MNWGDVMVMYVRELRAALRERAIVVNSLIIPIFLYPLMLWLTFSGITFVEGLAEGFRSRIVVRNLPAVHRELLDTLRAMDRMVVIEDEPDAGDPLVRVAAGNVDAFVDFVAPEASGAALPGNFHVSIQYDRSEERSRRAQERVADAVDRYRAKWLEREAAVRGLTREDLTAFRVNLHTVSTEREMGALVLSGMIPLFLVIMVAFGCFYPAIDATAGERERSTWETLMTVSASRMSVVVAKYLYVATMGIAAGILNVLAMFASMGAVLRPLLESETAGAFEFTLPPMAVPVMIIGAVALGLFFAAAMMILAAFARTFKEGQSMITPVFWLVLVPLTLGRSPDRTLTPILAMVPVANVAQMIKDAIRGIYLWPLILETVVVEVLLVIGCLMIARFILRFEDVLLGSHGGSFWQFLKDQVLSPQEQKTQLSFADEPARSDS
jgi:sodium transport system permease protein